MAPSTSAGACPYRRWSATIEHNGILGQVGNTWRGPRIACRSWPSREHPGGTTLHFGPTEEGSPICEVTENNLKSQKGQVGKLRVGATMGLRLMPR